jgi:hypothetical protein
MLPGQKKQREIKPIFGKIPAFLNCPINFCFNVEALSARSRRLPSSTPLPTHIGLDSRLLNPALRVSDFKDVLGLISMPKILRNTQKDCGKPGCPNDYRIQVLARGDEMIKQERRRPPLCRFLGRAVSSGEGPLSGVKRK